MSRRGRIARLTQGKGGPAHDALRCQVALSSGRSLGRDSRCRSSRSRARWTDHLRNYTGWVPANLWRQAVLREPMVEQRNGLSCGYAMTMMTTTMLPRTGLPC